MNSHQPCIEPLVASDELKTFLASRNLPLADISAESPILFFGVRHGGVLQATVGLELHGPHALLRSLAVAPAWRGRGLARALVAHAESFAAARGVESLFLLTTDAEAFFLKLGYFRVARQDAPAAIRATPQFASLCPGSSALLSKEIRIARHQVVLD